MKRGVLVLGQWNREDVVALVDMVRQMDEGIFLCVAWPARPSGESKGSIPSHILEESVQLPESLGNAAKHKQASHKGPRLEGTLWDQAIEQGWSLIQWDKALSTIW